MKQVYIVGVNTGAASIGVYSFDKLYEFHHNNMIIPKHFTMNIQKLQKYVNHYSTLWRSKTKSYAIKCKISVFSYPELLISIGDSCLDDRVRLMERISSLLQ